MTATAPRPFRLALRLTCGLALIAVARPATATAAACCVGTATTLPSRLGPCEPAGAGLSVGGSTAVARWTSQGQLSDTAMSEQTFTASLHAGWRWARWGQVGVVVPGLVRHRDDGAEAVVGAGLGDIRVLSVLEPFGSRFSDEGRSLAVPVFTAGLRAPTGRSWKEAQQPEQVTGRPGLGLLGQVSIENTSGRNPWTVFVGGELEISEGELRPAPELGATLGHAFGNHWSLSGSLTHNESWYFSGTRFARASSTNAGLQATYSVVSRWRAWASASAGLPIAGLGNDQLLEVGGSLGLLALF